MLILFIHQSYHDLISLQKMTPNWKYLEYVGLKYLLNTQIGTGINSGWALEYKIASSILYLVKISTNYSFQSMHIYILFER